MIDHSNVKDDEFRTYYKSISKHTHNKERITSPEPVLIEM